MARTKTRTELTAPFECQGADLRVGDTIEVWWKDKRDTIRQLMPYNPPAACGLPPGKWQTAYFAINGIGMTIGPDTTYTVLHRAK